MSDNYNIWLEKYLKNLKQNKYNLTKSGRYIGQIKILTDALIEILEDDFQIK